MLYTIHPRMYLGWCYLGFSRYLDRGVELQTVYHHGMYLGWRGLPGILKILGQGGILYTIPECTWDGMCCPGFSRYSDGGYSCILYTIPGYTWDACVTRDSQYTQTGGYSCILYTIPRCRHVLPGILKGIVSRYKR